MPRGCGNTPSPIMQKMDGMEAYILAQELRVSRPFVLHHCVTAKSPYCLHPTAPCSFHSPQQLHCALGLHRLLGDGLLEIKSQDLLRLREASAGVFPQWVWLRLPALSEIQGVLEEKRIWGLNCSQPGTPSFLWSNPPGQLQSYEAACCH